MNLAVTHSDGSRTEQLSYDDGTGLRTFYDSEGNITGTEELTGLPIVEPLSPTLEERAQELFAILAASGVTPDQLARVLALGVAVTEPESVDRLTTAVETGDLTDGMAVVAEAAVTAQVSVKGV